jgi:predicted RNA-binding protein YlxR (DUF448 family)
MPKKPVMRTCVICRKKKEKRELIRVVRSPQGKVSLDSNGKMPGRGAYLCCEKTCIESARKSGRLAQILEAEVPQSLYEEALEMADHAK